MNKSEKLNTIKNLTAELLSEEQNQISEPDRPHPSEPGQLVCPFAIQYKNRMKTRGKFRQGYPEGLVVHFNAGWDETEQHAMDTIEYGITQGYTFWTMSKNGTIYQSHPLSEWGYHAGSSAWPGLGTGLSQYLLGLEICCGGKLDKDLKSWFKKQYKPSETRTVKDKDNVQAGIYAKYSDSQEDVLIELCLWLKQNNPKVFSLDLVLGHDEIATPKGRKNDPGGSLSMTMPEFRELLKERYR